MTGPVTDPPPSGPKVETAPALHSQLTDAERQGAALLALLTAELEHAGPLERGLLEIAAHRVSDALATLGQLDSLLTPARRDPMEARSQSFPAVATTGGPVDHPFAVGGGRASGPVVSAGPHSAEGGSAGGVVPGAGVRFFLPVWPGTQALADSITAAVRAERRRRLLDRPR